MREVILENIRCRVEATRTRLDIAAKVFIVKRLKSEFQWKVLLVEKIFIRGVKIIRKSLRIIALKNCSYWGFVGLE